MPASPEYKYKVYQGSMKGAGHTERQKWLLENDIGCWIEATDDKKPYVPLSTYWCFDNEQAAVLFKLRWK